MLKLLVFVPCQKAIISKDDNTSSIITILEVINIGFNRESAASTDVEIAVPYVWYVYTLWHREGDEDAGAYEQRIILTMPDEQVRANLIMPFSVDLESRNFRHNIEIKGFPIPRVEGECSLKLELRKLNEQGEGEWREVGAYPIRALFSGSDEQPQNKKTATAD